MCRAGRGDFCVFAVYEFEVVAAWFGAYYHKGFVKEPFVCAKEVTASGFLAAAGIVHCVVVMAFGLYWMVTAPYGASSGSSADGGPPKGNDINIGAFW